MTSDGIIAAYRNRSDDEIRDNYVARLVNGKWTTPQAGVQRQLEDRRLSGERPVAQRQRQSRGDVLVHRKERSGPGLSPRSRRMPARRSRRRFAIDDGGTLGRVDLELLPDGSALATWIEFAPFAKTFGGKRTPGTVPRPAHRVERHALGAGHDRRHRRLALERISARRGGQRRSGVCLDRIRRRRRLAGSHRRREPVRRSSEMKNAPSRPAPGSAFLAIVVVAGVMLVLQGRGVSARPEPSGLEKRAALFMRGWLTPSTYKGLKNPVSDTDENFIAAREHFADHCATLPRQRRQRQHRDGPLALSEGAGHAAAAHAEPERRRDLLFHRERHSPDRHAGLEHRHARRANESSWQLVHFIRRLPKLTPDDLAAMEQFNPVSRAADRGREEDRRLPEGRRRRLRTRPP